MALIMKNTFFHLSDEKQQRIVSAALDEFSLSGYEKTSLDNIIRRAGISKGGLYEYIESKEGLFQYLLEISYDALRSFILSHGTGEMPSDPLERTRFISSVAVEFYIAEPKMISFIVRSSQLEQSEIRHRVQAVFDSYFSGLYDTANYDSTRYDRDRIVMLLKWLLVKTRNDFCVSMQTTQRPDLCRDTYLGEWDFFLDVLARGIYTKREG